VVRFPCVNTTTHPANSLRNGPQNNSSTLPILKAIGAVVGAPSFFGFLTWYYSPPTMPRGAAQPRKRTADGLVRCKYGCGKELTYTSISKHEKVCDSNPNKSTTVWICKRGCGKTLKSQPGIRNHELNCENNPDPPPPPPPKVLTCRFACGKEFNNASAKSLHEKDLRMILSSTPVKRLPTPMVELPCAPRII
jgi:hypothetical protein